MDKENLILTHSFPTNSIILQGLIEYLSDYFNVYFIDLPGFTEDVPPLSDVNFKTLSTFFADKVHEFNLDNYYVGGISFGFIIVNDVEYDKRCKAIFAIEPFLGPKSLNDPAVKRYLALLCLKLICGLNLHNTIWESDLVRRIVTRIQLYPSRSLEIMFDQIDGWTFFETAKMVISDKRVHQFHDLPYVLVANKFDQSINYNYVYEILRENVEHLLVINTSIEHYPKDLSKTYFQKNFSEQDLIKTLDFLKDQPAKG